MGTLASPEAHATETDMAKPADPVLVSRHAKALAAAGRDRSAFEAVLSEIREGRDLRASDVIAIAVAYRGGGARPRSRTHALEMIERRFVELVMDAKKNVVASRARPW